MLILRSFNRFILISLALLGLSVSSVSASVIYTYSGNNFTNIVNNTPPTGTFTGSDSVAGWFSVADFLAGDLSGGLLTVESFSFSAGSLTISDDDTDLLSSNFNISTDALGNITYWNVAFAFGENVFAPLAITGDQLKNIQTLSSLISVYDTVQLTECTDADTNGGCLTSTNRALV